MAPTDTVTPAVQWAQRSTAARPDHIYYNKIILTINVPDLKSDESPKDDAKNFEIKITDTTITFSATGPKTKYHFELELYAPVVGDESKVKHTGSTIEVLIPKKDENEEYWPRLSKDKAKLHYVTTDFDRWVDEDEQDEEEAASAEGFGDMGMGGMPGMGGMGGMDFNSLAGGGMPGLGDMGGFDMSSLAGMGGMGGMGGDDDDLLAGDDEGADAEGEGADAGKGSEAGAAAASGSSSLITELPESSSITEVAEETKASS